MDVHPLEGDHPDLLTAPSKALHHKLRAHKVITSEDHKVHHRGVTSVALLPLEESILVDHRELHRKLVTKLLPVVLQEDNMTREVLVALVPPNLPLGLTQGPLQPDTAVTTHNPAQEDLEVTLEALAHLGATVATTLEEANPHPHLKVDLLSHDNAKLLPSS